ncbi:hypothetical protein LCGC14_0211540 [marine sediment metagenome]|uniref:Uncharacterized protein n=1 Tax=marine sediment metagenome TaxID=412755 RepID=A0A0F9X013_9ZZZZ
MLVRRKQRNFDYRYLKQATGFTFLATLAYEGGGFLVTAFMVASRHGCYVVLRMLQIVYFMHLMRR